MPKRRDDIDDDAFDENGVLKDGRRIRVPLLMRDGMSDVQRIAQDAVARHFGLRNGGDLHAPGPRYCTDRAALDAKEAAYREGVRAMCDAWKTPSAQSAEPAADHAVMEASDAWKTNNDREVARVHDTGDAVRDAYLDYVADLTRAWSRRR